MNIIVLSEDTLQYDFVHGQHPRKISDVWSHMHKNVWFHTRNRLHCDRLAYIKYCESIQALPPRITRIINTWPLTQVAYCHGDLTISNVIFDRNDRMTLIDPSSSRDLPCVQMDESKLLQSWEGWDKLRWGIRIEHESWIGFEPKAIHYALLYTHYLRITRHEHPASCIAFAHDRMKAIRELLG
jgi:hypothetical protein